MPRSTAWSGGRPTYISTSTVSRSAVPAPVAELPRPSRCLPTTVPKIRPGFQLLVYPMLDDRTTTRTELNNLNVRMWTPKSNRYGWSSYLGDAVGGPDVSPYAAAARREDLTGLAPAWIGVGTLDLFHDEDVEYARRLDDSGVPCELHLVPGAFHGFDAVFPKAGISQQFWRQQARALAGALSIAAPRHLKHMKPDSWR